MPRRCSGPLTLSRATRLQLLELTPIFFCQLPIGWQYLQTVSKCVISGGSKRSLSMGEAGSNQEALLHVFWHDDCLKHNNGAGFFDMPQGTLPDDFLEVMEPHPEGVDRVKNMRSILKKGPISKHVQWHQGRTATTEQLLLFHKPDYIEKLEAAAKAADSQGQSVLLAGGTVMNSGTYDAILAAAGTTLAALDCIVQGGGKVAYALVRPPGHHAQTDRADGYCFVNNAGVAVAQARRSGFEKVAVIDVDVHHGNGTQEGFYTSPDVLTISLHMDHGSWDEETHPQQGAASERGQGLGNGLNMNIPLPFGTGDKGYDYAMQELVGPVVDRFAPNLIVVPLGLDGSAFDPNGRQALTMAGYKRLGERIRDWAAKHSEGRILVVQEGGYCVSYAAYCLHSFLSGLLGVDAHLDDPIGHYPENEATSSAAIKALKLEFGIP